jgi:hypothetical protein
MPKNSSVEVLRRWRSLDRALCGGPYGFEYGVEVSRFARQCRVSVKTVRRDLDAFRALGQEVRHLAMPGNEHYHCYAPGTRPLFACNLRPRGPG